MRRAALKADLDRPVTARRQVALVLVLLTSLAAASARAPAAPSLQGEVEVSPEATPEIKSVKPAQGRAGEKLTLAIEGANFSKGAYVSFSSPAVHAVSTRRASATELEVGVEIGQKAPSGPVTLYVSNTASAAVQATFTITAEPGAAPAASLAKSESRVSETPAPEVTAVDPPRVSRGSAVTLKLTGKNFARGARIAFSNPGIVVSEADAPKSTELTARLQAAPDAPTGKTSLFVVNPDDQEVEVGFEVTAESAAGAATKPASATPKPASTETPAAKSTPTTGGAAALRFEVFNLGSAAGILQSGGKAKGTLSLASGKLRYEEGGAEVFSAAASNVKEIGPNLILGVNTGTFHVILNNGKTYNFAAPSLRPADGESIVDSLRRAFH